MKKPLPLVVGGSVHKGLETLLRDAMGPAGNSGIQEESAVAAALADFSLPKSALALDTTEAAAMAPVEGFDAQVAAQARELGMSADDPAIAELFQRQRNAAAEFDSWLFSEQASLVEGMVRAYARRRLRLLLEEFEVLEVEREGDWPLADLADESGVIRFMSRPDALLRSRSDNSLYILSYKTAATWDIRKERDAQHDMQGLSEGVEVERRLGEWWDRIRHETPPWAWQSDPKLSGITEAEFKYLRDLPAPPRILGIRYEYLLKGGRWEDKELSRRFGITVWSQRSHLIRRFVAHSTPSRGKNAGGFDVGATAWSWDYHLEDGSASKLSASNWHGEPVWEESVYRKGYGETVKAWIDKLDATEMAMSAFDSTVGQEPREMGWKSEAQALGYTATHPLDDVFPAPMTIYRSDDQLRDWIEQVEASEVRVAEAVAQIEAAQDEGEKRHLLNVLMPMSRRACSYPTECPMAKAICFGGEDARRDPLGTGLFKVRTPHHAPEVEATKAVTR
jgi:hypothetical protein